VAVVSQVAGHKYQVVVAVPHLAQFQPLAAAEVQAAILFIRPIEMAVLVAAGTGVMQPEQGFPVKEIMAVPLGLMEPVAAVVVKARLEAMGRVILPVQVALVWRGQTA